MIALVTVAAAIIIRPMTIKAGNTGTGKEVITMAAMIKAAPMTMAKSARIFANSLA